MAIQYSISLLSTVFWHRDKVYFTCIKPLWGLISVPNMNKIHRFISDITCIKPTLWLITVPNMNKINTFWDIVTSKFKENIAIIILKFDIDPNAILHALATHSTWLLYQIWIKSTCSSLRSYSKHTKCMKKWHHY